MAWRCGVPRAARDAVRKPPSKRLGEAAVPVARANRRIASVSLDDAPHRPRLPSCPSDRPRDLYGSILRTFGIDGRHFAEALFKIMGGEEQEPTTGFAIYGLTIENEPDPVFAEIDFEWDIEGRKGLFSVSGILGAEVEPIANPVTGAPHFMSIPLYDGFEFREAEMASATL